MKTAQAINNNTTPESIQTNTCPMVFPGNRNNTSDENESFSSEKMVIDDQASDLEMDLESDENDSLPAKMPQPNRSSLTPGFGARILWDGNDDVPLEEWLSIIRPSDYSGDMNDRPYCSWIQVHQIICRADERKSTLRIQHPDLDLSKYERLLDKLGKSLQSTTSTAKKKDLRQECLHAIMGMAQQDGCVSGKWLIFSQTNETNQIWRKVAEATARGMLGPSSKVSPTKRLSNADTAVICVYVYDSTNKQEVQRVLKVLQTELGVTRGLSKLKPDIFTSVGIYSGNPWGLSTALYTAREAAVWEMQPGCPTTAHCK